MVIPGRLKNILQRTVFPLISFINKRINHNNTIIMLYDNMGFRDNIKVLYEYIVKESYNVKYKIICSTVDYKKFQDIGVDNVRFVNNLRGFLYYFKAGYVFYCAGKLPVEPGKSQEVVQMWHGVPLKAPDSSFEMGYKNMPTYFTHVYSPSKFLIPLYSKTFYVPEANVLVTGQPRNDLLFQKSVRYDLGEYKKIIVWTPTFRQSKIMRYSNSSAKNLIPLLTSDDYKDLNAYLKEREIMIYAKLHPLQTAYKKDIVKMSNFVIMTHEEFTNHGFDLYILLSQADAMISDYSSVFFDFLLRNKPLGFTEDDMQEYTEKRGFALEDLESYKAGDKLLTKSDLYRFIDDISKGVDKYAEERHKVNKLINDFVDGNSSKRALEVVGIFK